MSIHGRSCWGKHVQHCLAEDIAVGMFLHHQPCYILKHIKTKTMGGSCKTRILHHTRSDAKCMGFHTSKLEQTYWRELASSTGSKIRGQHICKKTSEQVKVANVLHKSTAKKVTIWLFGIRVFNVSFLLYSHFSHACVCMCHIIIHGVVSTGIQNYPHRVPTNNQSNIVWVNATRIWALP